MITIKHLNKTFKNQVVDICFKTGYMGESLKDKNIFNDKNLFAYFFCMYYVDYENELSFVALNEENKVIGYILGSEKNDIVLRSISYLIPILYLSLKNLVFDFSHTGKTILYFLTHKQNHLITKEIKREYPAHLHINSLKEVSGLGIGKKLLDTFEENLLKKNICGIHLTTTSENKKALKFYERNGYKLLREEEGVPWPNKEGTTLLFVKKLISKGKGNGR